MVYKKKNEIKRTLVTIQADINDEATGFNKASKHFLGDKSSSSSYDYSESIIHDLYKSALYEASCEIEPLQKEITELKNELRVIKMKNNFAPDPVKSLSDQDIREIEIKHAMVAIQADIDKALGKFNKISKACLDDIVSLRNNSSDVNKIAYDALMASTAKEILSLEKKRLETSIIMAANKIKQACISLTQGAGK